MQSRIIALSCLLLEWETHAQSKNQGLKNIRASFTKPNRYLHIVLRTSICLSSTIFNSENYFKSIKTETRGHNFDLLHAWCNSTINFVSLLIFAAF